MLTNKNKKAIDFCREILQDVSRSFALTIPLLDNKMKEPVMITYLQDRLLDSFEDEGDLSSDMREKYMDLVVEIFNPDISNDTDIIGQISNSAHYFDGSIKRLVLNANKLKTCFERLDPEIQQTSYKWLAEMNVGMKKYLDKPVDTFFELNEYCYYVAGTVGGFLTDSLITLGDVDSKDEKILVENFVEAGLFLQKVNIIRDIKLDIIGHKKHYWPLDELEITENELIDISNKKRSLQVLDKMITDVKKHTKALVEYYYAIPDQFSGYKKFYSVNNAMGFATLELIENNPDLFYTDKKLKIKKREVLKILAVSEDTFLKKANHVLNQ
jgi:farnesyl-diphosphate farnesyltransferase